MKRDLVNILLVPETGWGNKIKPFVHPCFALALCEGYRTVINGIAGTAVWYSGCQAQHQQATLIWHKNAYNIFREFIAVHPTYCGQDFQEALDVTRTAARVTGVWKIMLHPLARKWARSLKRKKCPCVYLGMGKRGQKISFWNSRRADGSPGSFTTGGWSLTNSTWKEVIAEPPQVNAFPPRGDGDWEASWKWSQLVFMLWPQLLPTAPAGG